MAIRLNLKAKLYVAAAGAFAAVLMMTAVSLYGNKSAHDALTRVFEGNVKPLLAAQEIDSLLKEVRFRIAGVLLDQLPAVGSKNHLAEVRGKLPGLWGEYKSHAMASTPESREILTRLEQGLARLPPLFDRLDKAYGAGDKKSLQEILEDEWPSIHAQVVKPLSQLLPQEAADVKRTYEESATLGQRLDVIALALSGVSALLMLVCTVLMVRSITGSVNALDRAMSELARGNLAARAAVRCPRFRRNRKSSPGQPWCCPAKRAPRASKPVRRSTASWRSARRWSS